MGRSNITFVNRYQKQSKLVLPYPTNVLIDFRNVRNAIFCDFVYNKFNFKTLEFFVRLTCNRTANNMTFESVSFHAAIRGYHVYRDVWQPQQNEILVCYHEYGNIYDMFAIKTCRVDVGAETIVGHLPIEVSRLTKFLLDRGATVTATLTSKSYRRSPLVQGGLEIPCLVQAKMIGTQINKIILSKYLNMIKEIYVEPDPDETIIAGTFLEPDEVVENACAVPVALSIKQKRKKKKKPDPRPLSKSKDIRDLFKQQMLKVSQKGEEDDISIVSVVPAQ